MSARPAPAERPLAPGEHRVPLPTMAGVTGQLIDRRCHRLPDMSRPPVRARWKGSLAELVGSSPTRTGRPPLSRISRRGLPISRLRIDAGDPEAER